MNAFIDDLRKEPKGWMHFKTITSFIKALATMDFEVISLDHDIRHWHTADPKLFKCEENFTAVAWAITLMPKERLPKEVWVHSSNIEAYPKVRDLLTPFGIKVKRAYYFDETLSIMES